MWKRLSRPKQRKSRIILQMGAAAKKVSNLVLRSSKIKILTYVSLAAVKYAPARVDDSSDEESEIGKQASIFIHLQWGTILTAFSEPPVKKFKKASRSSAQQVAQQKEAEEDEGLDDELEDTDMLEDERELDTSASRYLTEEVNQTNLCTFESNYYFFSSQFSSPTMIARKKKKQCVRVFVVVSVLVIIVLYSSFFPLLQSNFRRGCWGRWQRFSNLTGRRRQCRWHWGRAATKGSLVVYRILIFHW